MKLLTCKGGVLANADITILAEAPKIAPHIPAMKAVLAPLLQLSPDRIAVKATNHRETRRHRARRGHHGLCHGHGRLP